MLSGPKAAGPILTTTSFGTQHAGPTTRFVTGRLLNGNGIDRAGLVIDRDHQPAVSGSWLAKARASRGKRRLRSLRTAPSDARIVAKEGDSGG
jgi:hypothetical protein